MSSLYVINALNGAVEQLRFAKKKTQKNTTMQPKNRNIRQTASILLIIGVVATWLSASQPSVNSFPKTTPSHQSCGRFSVTKLYISTDFYRQNSGCRLQGEATELSRVSSAVHSFNPSSFWSLWSSKPPFYGWTSWRLFYFFYFFILFFYFLYTNRHKHMQG